MEHELKIKSEYYLAVRNNKKTFEIRKNDRNFKVNDYLVLKEIDKNGDYTGFSVTKTITYILSNVDGLDNDYCILGIK